MELPRSVEAQVALDTADSEEEPDSVSQLLPRSTCEIRLTNFRMLFVERRRPKVEVACSGNSGRTPYSDGTADLEVMYFVPILAFP